MNCALETVYLSRHGETEWNVSRRRQGQSDSPLTPDGIDQARAIAMIASHLPIDRIFTSPLGRATATAVIAGHATGVPLEIVDDLAEVDHGQFAGLTNDEIEARHPGVLAERAGQKYTWRFPMGESYHDADTRAGRALEYMHAAGSRRPLLVTHEMVGLMVLRRLLDLTPEAALARSLPHGQVLEVVPSRTSVRVVRAR